MNEELLKPFVLSTIHVLETMAQTKAVPGDMYEKPDSKTWGEVTGIIGMIDPKAAGNIVISFDRESILGIVSNMLMEEFTKVTPDVVDAVGEITNMICGGTKAALSEQGFAFNMARPLTLHGTDIDLQQKTKERTHVIPFETGKGRFVLEVSFESTG